LEEKVHARSIKTYFCFERLVIERDADKRRERNKPCIAQIFTDDGRRGKRRETVEYRARGRSSRVRASREVRVDFDAARSGQSEGLEAYPTMLSGASSDIPGLSWRFLRASSSRCRRFGEMADIVRMSKATFDLAAGFYPLLEQIVFGSKLSRARRVFISRVTEGSRILLIGEGNGRYLCEVVKQTSSASITVVDSSARMLAAASHRVATLGGRSRIELIQADILEWQSSAGRYDRIVTHFVLDLFPPDRIRRLVEKISQLAMEDCLWINVDFTSENQSSSQKFLMWAQYRFFRIFAGIEASRLFDSRLLIRNASWEVLETRLLYSGLISACLLTRKLSVSVGTSIN
jgi:tRNA (cmo5U34)-methyltransferase